MSTRSFADFAEEQYCYLTTTGRTSGEPRTIEIWFGTGGETLYMLAGGGGKAHWVRNLLARPEASVRIGEYVFEVSGRTVEDEVEDSLARRLLLAKYSGNLEEWGRTALPVALDLRD